MEDENLKQNDFRVNLSLDVQHVRDGKSKER